MNFIIPSVTFGTGGKSKLFIFASKIMLDKYGNI